MSKIRSLNIVDIIAIGMPKVIRIFDSMKTFFHEPSFVQTI